MFGPDAGRHADYCKDRGRGLLRRVIITTAGISLLIGWKNRYGKNTATLPELTFHLKESSGVCAETHSLAKLGPDPRYDHLYFLGSGTGDGRLCMDAIVHHYHSQGFQYVLSEAIPGLGRNYADMQQRGLINLLQSLSKIIQYHPGASCVINATGGFKAQTSFATLFGILLGIEVVYLHEDFGGLLRFPPMPVAFDYQLINEYGDAFSQVLRAESNKDARDLIKTLPSSLQGFFQKMNGHYGYSPVGRLFLEAAGTKVGEKAYTIRSYKSHASVWGDGVDNIGQISEPARSIMRRIFDCSDAVTAIYLDEMVNRRDPEIHFEYIETRNHALRYLVHTPKGGQYIKVEVLPGHERRVLHRIGRRIYP